MHSKKYLHENVPKQFTNNESPSAWKHTDVTQSIKIALSNASSKLEDLSPLCLRYQAYKITDTALYAYPKQIEYGV